MTEFNKFQQVKRRFFSMRNGVVVDTLRKAGSPFRIIFGMNLPQIVEVAGGLGRDQELGWRLWENTSTRESMLLAPMLLDPDAIEIEDAVRMCGECPASEVADVLCHRLLRHTPFVWSLIQKLSDESEEIYRYCAMRLLWHHVYSRPAEAESIARKELARNSRMTAGPALQIVDEVAFMNDASVN